MGKGARERGLGAEEEEQINIDPGVLQHVLRLTISFFFFFCFSLARWANLQGEGGWRTAYLYIYNVCIIFIAMYSKIQHVPTMAPAVMHR